MGRLPVALLITALTLASDAVAQCPPSNLSVTIAQDSSPGCVTVTPDDERPELNITNECGDNPFHIEGGIDCPYCGPPLTLRPGTFGKFIAETRGLTDFTPQSVASSHALAWASGDQTGTLQVSVVPFIVPCPEPDVGVEPDMSQPASPSPTDDGDGGCATGGNAKGSLPGWWVVLIGVLLQLTRRSKVQSRTAMVASLNASARRTACRKDRRPHSRAI